MHPIEDCYIYNRCPQCGTVMAFDQAWTEANDLVVISVECTECHYSDIVMVHPHHQPATAMAETPGKYIVSQFDNNTFVVVDRYTNREVCTCSNYEGGVNAQTRATWIAEALNRCYHSAY